MPTSSTSCISILTSFTSVVSSHRASNGNDPSRSSGPPDLKPLYVGFADMPLVSISDAQREPIAKATSSLPSTTAFPRIYTPLPIIPAAVMLLSLGASRRKNGRIALSGSHKLSAFR